MATHCGPDPILARWILPGSVLPDLTATSAPGALDELVEAVAGTLPGVSRAALRHGFAEREALGSTAVGGGFAIPHCRIAGPRELVLRVARHPAGVDFGAPDGRPVNVFFAVVAPTSAAATHLEALRAIARYVREPGRLALLLAARGSEEVRQRLLEAGVPGLRNALQTETAGV